LPVFITYLYQILTVLTEDTKSQTQISALLSSILF